MSGRACFYFLSDVTAGISIQVQRLEGIQPVDSLLQMAEGGAAGGCTAGRSSLELLLECQVFVDGRPLVMPQFTQYRSFPSARVAEWKETVSFPCSYRDLCGANGARASLAFRVWEVCLAGGGDGVGDAGDGRRLLGGGSFRLFSDTGLLKTGMRRITLSPDFDLGDISGGSGAAEERLVNRIQQEKLRQRLATTIVEPKGLEWLDKLEKYRLQALSKETDSIGGSQQSNAMMALARQLRIRAGGSAVGGAAESALLRYERKSEMCLTVEFPEFRFPVVYYATHAPSALPPIVSASSNAPRIILHDPAHEKENPIEQKFRKMAKGASQFLDAKPNGRERIELKRIMDEPYHSKEMKVKDKMLLWKFRSRLTKIPGTITRFLRSVDFSDAEERDEALAMLKLWENEKTVTVEDALELLSMDFRNPNVREFAVRQLETVTADEVEKYLMLLVQAVQNEEKYPSPLSDFICRRASQRLGMANVTAWYLTVEAEENPKMYRPFLKDFFDKHLKSTTQGAQWFDDIMAQREVVGSIRKLCQMVTAKGGKRGARVSNLRSALTEGKFRALTRFKKPIRFPLDPKIKVTGIIAESSTVFASNAFPFLIAFETEEEGAPPVKVIYKEGDDLRQDQLIMQLVSLMDSRLKKNGLDLQIVSFQVQGWSVNDGIIEFVPGCTTIEKVIEDHKDIGRFLEEHNPKPKGMETALMNWVKSSAGYSVITYILAIGDRHLDNILLTTQGHMLHIDFGYIFGRDPKPFPPKVKFTTDMMKGMGGKQFEDLFYQNSCLSYNLLRRDACLILNLLYLTGDWAGNKKDNLTCIRSRLALERDDDEAAKEYRQMIYKVMHSTFETFKDGIHTIATNLKK